MEQKNNKPSVDPLKQQEESQQNPIPEQRSKTIKVLEPIQRNFEKSPTMMFEHQIKNKSQNTTNIQIIPQNKDTCHRRTSDDAALEQCKGKRMNLSKRTFSTYSKKEIFMILKRTLTYFLVFFKTR